MFPTTGHGVGPGGSCVILDDLKTLKIKKIKGKRKSGSRKRISNSLAMTCK